MGAASGYTPLVPSPGKQTVCNSGTSTLTRKFSWYLLALLALFTFQVAASEPEVCGSAKYEFIENKGQIIDQNNELNPGVLYLLNGNGLNVQLRRGGFSYDVFSIEGSGGQEVRKSGGQEVRKSGGQEVRKSGGQEVRESEEYFPRPAGFSSCEIDTTPRIYKFHRVDLDLVGANPFCQIIAEEPSSDYINYYTTGTTEEGVTYVRHFAKITYIEVYPNIDLEFFAHVDKGFKYNFILRPGARLEDIQVNISGPDETVLTQDVIKFMTSVGEIREIIPESFLLNDEGTRSINVAFKKNSSNFLGFRTDQPIPEGSTLIIDPEPELIWGTYYGGSLGDQLYSCSWNGFLFVTGTTQSSNNIATSGAHQSSFGGVRDALLAKFNSSGIQIWGTYYGGSQLDIAREVCVDQDGYVYMAGYTFSPNNISTPGAYKTTNSGTDAFLVRFNDAGVRQWGTYFGGNITDYGYGCTYNGAVILAGVTNSTAGIASPGAYQTTLAGYNDGFIVSFSTEGVLNWSTYYGGESTDDIYSMTTDYLGNIYITGITLSSTGIASSGAFQDSHGGGWDAFLTKFSASGTRLWGSYYGGSGDDRGYSCQADTSILFAGATQSTSGIATTGAHQTTIGSSPYTNDGFFAKFNPDGSRIWGSYYGGEATDQVNCIKKGPEGTIYLCGYTNSSTNIATPGSYLPTLPGSSSSAAFAASFSAQGVRNWGTYYGGIGNDNGEEIQVSNDHRIYMVGYAQSTSGISTAGSHQTTLNGIVDGMIVKFQDCTVPGIPGSVSGNSSVCQGSTGNVCSITPIAGATGYTWTVPAGFTITAGQNTTTITVSVASGASSGNLSVIGTNSCGDGPSSSLAVAVNPSQPVSVSIVGSPSGAVCAGTSVTYTATPTNGGSTPAYQWKVNGLNVGTNSTTYSYSPTDGDVITCELTSNATCATGSPATSNTVTMTVNPEAPVSVSIAASPSGSVCTGTSVTYTATALNGGSSPVYQWKINGVNVPAVSSPTLNYTPADGDVITCELTSNASCATGNPATSNTLSMTVNPNLPVSVSIAASPLGAVCEGSSVTFTATPTNGGLSPSYHWEVNGTTLGTNSPTCNYTPTNGDVITSELTSSEACATGSPATSNAVTMTVNPNLPVSVSVAESANPVCAGTSVTYTATPTNGGSSPVYQWKINGLNVGSNSTTYNYIPVGGDAITCELTSNATCATGSPATSNIVTMTVNPILTASLSITASENPSCLGTAVTYIATPTNGGNSPVYQWKVNGSDVGTSTVTYSYTPTYGDIISCSLTSNETCITGNPANSNNVAMTVNQLPVVSLLICEPATSREAKPILLSGGIPLNGTYTGTAVSGGILDPSQIPPGGSSIWITYAYTNSDNCTDTSGQEVTVYPSPTFSCGDQLTDFRSGQQYSTVLIDAQCWMAENLAYGNTLPGSQLATDNCTPEKHCYDNNGVNCTTYGGLYDWDELMQYQATEGVQGLCPPGWHIPSEADWQQLITVLNGQAYAGEKLKPGGSSGFSALFGGLEFGNFWWEFEGISGFFWSSTPSGPYKAIAHGINEESDGVSTYPAYRFNAFSVRCLKN